MIPSKHVLYSFREPPYTCSTTDDLATKDRRSGSLATLYHTTSAALASVILRTGFRDTTGTDAADRPWKGVWLSDAPPPPDGTVGRDTVLRVVLAKPDAFLDAFEVAARDTGSREFVILSMVVNPAILAVEIERYESESQWQL